MRVYDVPGGTLLHEFEGHADVVFGIAFRPVLAQLPFAFHAGDGNLDADNGADKALNVIGGGFFHRPGLIPEMLMHMA